MTKKNEPPDEENCRLYEEGGLTLRQIGTKRIPYGADAALGSNLRPRESWDAFCRLDHTDDEIKTIVKNSVPYLR
jgi:hypothetical protein